jgi:hypothetical protein
MAGLLSQGYDRCSVLRGYGSTYGHGDMHQHMGVQGYDRGSSVLRGYGSTYGRGRDMHQHMGVGFFLNVLCFVFYLFFNLYIYNI